MAKYSERLTDKFVKLIENDFYTISEICEALKVSRHTFYEWKNTKPEFRKAIEDAEDHREDMLANLARHSLRQQLEGYTVTTERTVYEIDAQGREREKSRVVTKKKCAPSARIIKLALERQDKQQELRRERQKEEESKERKFMPLVLQFPKGTDIEETVQQNILFESTLGNRHIGPEQIERTEDEQFTTVRIN